MSSGLCSQGSCFKPYRICRMNFHNTTICFVCSHLAAHQAEVDRRNQDYQQIMAGLQFSQASTSPGDPVTARHFYI